MFIRKKIKYIIIILLIILIVVINILIVQTKDEVRQRIFLQSKNLAENLITRNLSTAVNFLEITENLDYSDLREQDVKLESFKEQDVRQQFLKEYLKNNYYNKTYNKIYNKYSEESLLSKIKENNLKLWTLNIESIGLLADISQGTSEEILNKDIGHFEETNIFNGNVGLAAHNRGYPVNYFENLDKLKIGVVINYRIDNFIKKYKVKSINIIRDTDWTYLAETDEDTLTLITCVINKPEYRLCVQAYKESEEILNNAEKNVSSKYGNNFIIKYNFSRCS